MTLGLEWLELKNVKVQFASCDTDFDIKDDNHQWNGVVRLYSITTIVSKKADQAAAVGCQVKHPGRRAARRR